jgi:hypothetical protein
MDDEQEILELLAQQLATNGVLLLGVHNWTADVLLRTVKVPPYKLAPVVAPHIPAAIEL